MASQISLREITKTSECQENFWMFRRIISGYYAFSKCLASPR